MINAKAVSIAAMCVCFFYFLRLVVYSTHLTYIIIGELVICSLIDKIRAKANSKDFITFVLNCVNNKL